MIAVLPIALAAGSASALMFASIVSGALISLVLFYLSPLPLMVTALGWGPLAATIGGIAAASCLGAIFGLPYCAAFAITVAVPAWWLGHLALLGRPIQSAVPAPDAAPVLEWYPVGRILLWIAGFAVLTTTIGLFSLGSDSETLTQTVHGFLVKAMGPDGTASPKDIERWSVALAAIVPSIAVIVSMLTLTINLFLAGKVAATSGRLNRPWPDLKATVLPPMSLVAVSVALALCFVGGFTALFARIAATALMMAYALVGFAVLHTVTQTSKGRGLWLSCTYAVVVIFSWPVLAMVALGLADAVFGFRQRYLRGKQPPPLPAS